MSKKQELLGLLRAAVDRYGMIQEGDRIAVGVSGGKDSMALLALLAEFRRFSPASFSLTAITLDPAFDGVESDFSAVAAWCADADVPYILKRTRLAEAAIAQSQGKPPCSLCAKMRRGVLHRTAVEAGCNVVALGHHKDDAAETVLMNLLEGSRFACFAPVTDLDRRGLRLIRPLLLMNERDIAAFTATESLPTVASRCPVDGHTHRQKAKDLVTVLSSGYGDVTEKIVHALAADHINHW